MALSDGSVQRSGAVTGRRLQKTAQRILRRYSFGFALLLAVCLLVANLVKESGSFGLTSQLADFAPMALAAMASTPAIVSGGGGFDLSVSPLMYFVNGIIVFWLIPHGLGGIELIPIALAIGTAVGAISGLVIVLLRIQPVVATLSMYFILIGVDLQVAPNPRSFSSGWILHLAGSVGPVPGALFTLGVPLIIWWLLGRVPFRRILFAVGSSDMAAVSSGVNVSLVRVAAYALGGLFSAVGGIAVTALIRSAEGSLATSYTLLGLAAVALGGTSMAGGRGGLFGSIVGAAVIYLLENLLSVLQIDPSWLQVMYGTMLLIAVVLGGRLAMTKDVEE